MSVDTTAAEAWKAQHDSNAAALKKHGAIEESASGERSRRRSGRFPHLFRGEEVYLCWRMDESDIDHWHGVNEGFADAGAIDRNSKIITGARVLRSS